MKILIFGGAGQLGREINYRARDLAFEVISPVQGEVDISDREPVQFLVSRLKPDIIINCAAYTAVDKAEEEIEAAYKTNRDGPALLAEMAREHGARFIHISTDYVFAGDGERPLTEEDVTTPLSIYGKSKLEGEQAVTSILKGEGLIVRTSSLHGQYGANFVHTMLKLFDEGKDVRVVDDQWMSPTWAGFLAEAVLDLSRIKVGGIVHCSCKGVVSWHDFAREILKTAYTHDKLALLSPTKMADFPRPAPRPKYSPFNLQKLESLLGRPALSWQEGLRYHLSDLKRGLA